MKVIDIVFLLLIVVTGLMMLTKSGINISMVRRWFFLLIGVGLIKFFDSGYQWHYLIGYIYIIISLVSLSILENQKITVVKSLLFRGLVLLALTFCLVPWALLLPEPQHTIPGGEHSIGTKIFRWVDPNRSEEMTVNSKDKRNIIVQAWYPSEKNIEGSRSEYLEGLQDIPDEFGIFGKVIMSGYSQMRTVGVVNAPLSKKQDLWPVIIFLTGNQAPRAFYTSIVTGLASSGYIVLTVDHPYESLITELVDGRVVSTSKFRMEDDPEFIKLMEKRADIRIADISFILEKISRPDDISKSFLASIDINRIGIAGHSFGGAIAGKAMALDGRIKGAVNIDGTLYGGLEKTDNNKPFLLLESKKSGSGEFLRYEEGNRKFFKYFTEKYRYEMLEADHYSFTDIPLFMALPSRFLTNHLLGVGNVSRKTHTATVDILDSFFRNVFSGKTVDLEGTMKPYTTIVKKEIN